MEKKMKEYVSEKLNLFTSFCGSLSCDDTDIIRQIITMGIFPNGKEDPKDIMSYVSDSGLQSLLSIPKIDTDAIFQKVMTFFVLEWGLRNGYISEWYWQWDGIDEGFLIYYPPINVTNLLRIIRKIELTV